MSKFSDLIQKKHEMLKVTMKVDPAACKNGEITHFQEYVGFVLSEKEFEKTYEKLLKKYTLQNEGFFDAVKSAGKAVLNKIKDDIVSPFTDPKFNPFVGKGDNPKPVDTSEAGQIINEIKNSFLDINKTVKFLIGKKEISKSYKQLGKEDASIASFYGNFKKIFATKSENFKNSSFLNLIYEVRSSITPRVSRTGVSPRVSRTGASPRASRTSTTSRVARTTTTPPTSGTPSSSTTTTTTSAISGTPSSSRTTTTPPTSGTPSSSRTTTTSSRTTTTPPTSGVPSSSTATTSTSGASGGSKVDINNLLSKGIALTDINTQISVRNLKETFLPQIKSKIEEENKKRAEMRQEKFKSSANDVWSTLVQEVEKTFKQSRSADSFNQEKILWIFILAQPDQKIKLTYNPSKQ